MLDVRGISYRSTEYELSDGFTSGSDIARMQGLDPDAVFKTLVTESGAGEHFVCVIPVDCRPGFKESGEAFRRKKDGNASDEKTFAADRLCSRRLFSRRHEKTVSHGHR